ncbi:spectrin beta chain, non-erythrocytic 1-like isoform X8 [Acipenser ruthenus]|uniref:spectrin beta chain, non-erythrocytic 1-like isoform X8 n=1 Tax=Acipenser ruthenus TaxID=7906 RepID=UPI0027429382|nr:spectrin beta chain, non-erythrocytic 1-like isoform X8 [Acipenser ruthenus]
MSESIVRKVQPFTIGTKLSVPAVPKGTDFADSFLPSSSLDNCKMQHNLNNQVSLYLGHSPIHPSDSHFSPMAARVLLTERCQEEKAEEDHLNRNAVSPTASSRSIKKITISSWTEKTGDKVDSVAHCPKVMAAKSENSNNNNNAAIIPPKIVGVSCESKPNSHFKVLLRKEDEEEHKNTRSSHGTAGFLRPTVLKDFPSHLPTESRAPFLRRDVPKKESTVPGNVEKHKQQSDYSLTQRITQFNREILQAETWIKGTLQDLKDGCSIQRCPLQDWEQVSQTLQRDLKDFEKTMIQLNQMGEQLICKQNPTSDTVRKQLSQLKDQWQTLKQTAANQSKALGGARNLQEFNRKVDKLESWLKGKVSEEEKQSLVVLLEENIDKMQLTRRILDLKQDEQQYRALHDEIDSLAVRLEKQGKNEGKNISARRKHINKMWLKTQNLLKDYHEKLQLALEASSFSQQADNIIRATNNKRKIVCGANGQENSGDREMRDIASQIMMLDVTVSQLSNLHPTLAERVTQKQREVKNTWALLQQAVRNEKSGLPSPCSDFTREDGDPLTSTRELQCSMGKEVQRFMGKEVQEEQNRLKECVASEAVQPGKSSTEAGGATGSQTAREPGSNRKLAESQDEQQCSKSSPLPGTGSSPCETDDVIGRRQTDGESRRKKPEAKASLHHRYPQLQVQLQKFTVSADKTLSWLKDNVAMATQVCCAENYQSFEAAKRCQAALEDEILSNRTRIEVVKKEGRSLVRAQHPGSTKIEEFLRQLEVLWEELKKRHQKNDAVLQELEKTNLQAMTVLKDLHDMGEWLKTVESSISLCALSGDPESMNAAERESSLLENEVASRGLELRALRQEVEKLRSRRHFHKEELPSKRGEVEEKYYCVQNMLKQQTSELQDTRMLTEFLEKVEMEENQVKKRISHMSSIGQPLHSELGCHGSSMLVLADAGQQLIDSGRFDSDDIADPLEELREAVEMLNDTVRERGRSLTEDHGLEEQLRRLGDTHSNITARISRMLSQSAELSSDILKMETDMSVKCEPDLCRLENLNNQQEDMEIDFEVIKEEVDEMEKQAARLQVLYPERVQILGEQVQETLQAWEEMGKCIAENSGRLSQALQLQDFFRNYLAMISWTEDTRTCIFSESPVNPGKEGRLPETEELDTKIEQKFQEFEELAAAGQKLIDEEHHLTEIIKERTEELRSMLGWILVRWRAQKHQRSRGKTKAEPKGDVIYSEATVCTPQSVQGFSPCLEEQYVFQERSTGCRVGSCTDRLHPQKPRHSSQSEGGYEEMTPIHPKGSELNSSGGSLEGLLVLESPESPLLVLKEPSAPSLGGTVNLILSFSKKRDSQLQLQDPMDESETQEPIHRDQSVSLLSVHMGVEGNGKQPVYSEGMDCDCAEQGHTINTRGHCSITNGNKAEFESMEGTLERKHKLQLGGKRASCRTWNPYHAVLFKQSLCFYQDRKDMLQSSIAGVPLNLTGAVCSPAPDYTKKMHCFRLQLRDGSEYLLSAPSGFLMKKWILKIKANTGLSDLDPARSIPGCPLPVALCSQSAVPCSCSTACNCPHGGATTSLSSGHRQSTTAKTKEITVLTRENTKLPNRHRGHSEDLAAPLSSDAGHREDYYGSLQQSMRKKLPQRNRDASELPPDSFHTDRDQELAVSKRRSHSFTSAAYQKITPISKPLGGSEFGPSYSVTLLIGEQLGEAEPVSNSPESTLHREPQLIGWHPEILLDKPGERNYGSLPRPRNKSVFQKFFGKKE